MKTVDYKVIRKRIEQSPFMDGFDKVIVRKEVFYSPNGKYRDEDEYRDLALLAVFPYVHKIARLASHRFAHLLKDNSYMGLDDFIQDIFEHLIKNWHRWNPKKFKLTTMIWGIGMKWLFHHYRYRRIAGNVYDNKVYSFFDEESGLVGGDDYFQRHESNDNIENGKYELDKVEDKILLKGLLVDIKERLTQRQFLIFEKRYIDKWSYEKIGKYLGVSRERIRQILHGSSNGNRYYFNEEYLHPYSIKGRISKLKHKFMEA